MAVVPQSDDGDVDDANAYVTIAEFKAYHDDRGNSYSAYSDPVIGQAIVRATDFIEQRWKFRGVRLTSTQTTEWPRKAGASIIQPWLDIDFIIPIVVGETDDTFTPLVDFDGNDILGIPTAIKRASYEYAFRALTILLFQDAPAPEGGRQIDEHTVKVDVIEESIKYTPGQAGAFALPVYPAADQWVIRAGLVDSSRNLIR